MKRLICLLTGHRFSPWRLRSRHRALGIVDDYTSRSCSCCGRVQRSELRPGWKL